MAHEKMLSMGEAADSLGMQVWRLRRAFERGLWPEPQRAGRQRLIPENDLPALREALLKAGYIKGAGERTQG